MKIREKCCCHKHHINVCFVWYKKHKNDQEKKYLWFFKGAKDDGNNLYANKSFQGKKLSRKKEQLNSCCYPKKEEFWSFNFFQWKNSLHWHSLNMMDYWIHISFLFVLFEIDGLNSLFSRITNIFYKTKQTKGEKLIAWCFKLFCVEFFSEKIIQKKQNFQNEKIFFENLFPVIIIIAHTHIDRSIFGIFFFGKKKNKILKYFLLLFWSLGKKISFTFYKLNSFQFNDPK